MFVHVLIKSVSVSENSRLLLIETTFKILSRPDEKSTFFLELNQNVKYLFFTALRIQTVTIDKKWLGINSKLIRVIASD